MSECVTRFALGLEYNGSDFSGWQRQGATAPVTIQKIVEEGLSKVAGQSVLTVCAGRTDAGVHATQQVVHFDSFVDRGSKAWTVGVNSQLPSSIRILWVRQVAADFSARAGEREHGGESDGHREEEIEGRKRGFAFVSDVSRGGRQTIFGDSFADVERRREREHADGGRGNGREFDVRGKLGAEPSGWGNRREDSRGVLGLYPSVWRGGGE